MITMHLSQKQGIPQRNIFSLGTSHQRYETFHSSHSGCHGCFYSFQYLPLPDIPVPEPSPKAAYGKVHLNFVADLWDVLHTPLTAKIVHSTYPLTFEALNQSYGYVLYCTRIQGHFPDPSPLELKGLADRAYIYIDQVRFTSN